MLNKSCSLLQEILSLEETDSFSQYLLIAILPHPGGRPCGIPSIHVSKWIALGTRTCEQC